MNTSQNIAKAYDALELAHRALRDELKVLRADNASDDEIAHDEISRVANALSATGLALDRASGLVA